MLDDNLENSSNHNENDANKDYDLSDMFDEFSQSTPNDTSGQERQDEDINMPSDNEEVELFPDEEEPSEMSYDEWHAAQAARAELTEEDMQFFEEEPSELSYDEWHAMQAARADGPADFDDALSAEPTRKDFSSDEEWNNYLKDIDNGVKEMYGDTCRSVMDTIASEVRSGAAYELEPEWAKTVYGALIHEKVDAFVNQDYAQNIQSTIDKADTYFSHPGSPTEGDYPSSFLASFGELYREFTGKEYDLPVPNSEKIERSRPDYHEVGKALIPVVSKTEDVEESKDTGNVDKRSDEDEKTEACLKEAFSDIEDVFGKEAFVEAISSAITDYQENGVSISDALSQSMEKSFGIEISTNTPEIEVESPKTEKKESFEKPEPEYGSKEYHAKSMHDYEEKLANEKTNYKKDTFYSFDTLKMYYHAYKSDTPIRGQAITKADVFLKTVDFLHTNILETLVVRAITSWLDEKKVQDVERKVEDQPKEVTTPERVPRDIDGNPEYGKIENVPNANDRELYRIENPDYGKYYGADTSLADGRSNGREVASNIRTWTTGKPVEYYVPGTDVSIKLPGIRLAEIEGKSHCHVSPFGTILHVDRLNNPDTKLEPGQYIRALDISISPKTAEQIETLANARGVSKDTVKEQITADCKNAFVARFEQGFQKEIPRLEKQIESQKGLREVIGQYSDRIESVAAKGKADTVAVDNFRSVISKSIDRSDTYIKMLETRINDIKIAAKEMSSFDKEGKYITAAYSEVSTIARTREYEPLDPKDMDRINEFVDKAEKDEKPDVAIPESKGIEVADNKESDNKSDDKQDPREVEKNDQLREMEIEKEDIAKNENADDVQKDMEKDADSVENHKIETDMKDDVKPENKDDAKEEEKAVEKDKPEEVEKTEKDIEDIEKQERGDEDPQSATEIESQKAEMDYDGAQLDAALPEKNDMESEEPIGNVDKDPDSEPAKDLESDQEKPLETLEAKDNSEEDHADKDPEKDTEKIENDPENDEENEVDEIEKDVEEKDLEEDSSENIDRESAIGDNAVTEAKAEDIDKEKDDSNNQEEVKETISSETERADDRVSIAAGADSGKEEDQEENETETSSAKETYEKAIADITESKFSSLSDIFQNYVDNDPNISFIEDVFDMMSNLPEGFSAMDLFDGFADCLKNSMETYLDKVEPFNDLLSNLFASCPEGIDIAAEHAETAMANADIPQEIADELISNAELSVQEIPIEIPQVTELDDMTIVTGGEETGISDPITGESLNGLEDPGEISNLENAIDRDLLSGDIQDMLDKGLSAPDAQATPDVEIEANDVDLSGFAKDTASEVAGEMDAGAEVAEIADAGEEILLALL